MACSDPFGRVPLADVSLTLTASTLTFSVTATGDNLYQFRLRELIVITACDDEGVMLRDGMSTITISNASLATLGSSGAAIETAANTARTSTGGGGGGDATAANQETIINNRLGTKDEGPASGAQRVVLSDESVTAVQNTLTGVDAPMTRSTTAGTIAAGAYAFSVANIGDNAGVYDGQVFDAGLSVSWPVLPNNSTYSSKTYDATNTIFIITESR